MKDRLSGRLPYLNITVVCNMSALGKRTRWLMEVGSAVLAKTDTNRDRRNVRLGQQQTSWLMVQRGSRIRSGSCAELILTTCGSGHVPFKSPESGEPFFDTHYCRVVVTIECPEVDAGESFAPNAANVHSRANRK